MLKAPKLKALRYLRAFMIFIIISVSLTCALFYGIAEKSFMRAQENQASMIFHDLSWYISKHHLIEPKIPASHDLQSLVEDKYLLDPAIISFGVIIPGWAHYANSDRAVIGTKVSEHWLHGVAFEKHKSTLKTLNDSYLYFFPLYDELDQISAVLLLRLEKGKHDLFVQKSLKDLLGIGLGLILVLCLFVIFRFEDYMAFLFQRFEAQYQLLNQAIERKLSHKSAEAKESVGRDNVLDPDLAKLVQKAGEAMTTFKGQLEVLDKIE